MNHSMPGLPAHHQLPEFTQTHAHCVGDAIQPSHPLSSPSPSALSKQVLHLSSNESKREKSHVANIKCRAKHQLINYSIFRLQFSSVAQSCPTTCDPMNRSTPGLPVHHQLPESTQTHVHCVGDAMHPAHPLSSPSPPALNLS